MNVVPFSEPCVTLVLQRDPAAFARIFTTLCQHRYSTGPDTLPVIQPSLLQSNLRSDFNCSGRPGPRPYHHIDLYVNTYR